MYTPEAYVALMTLLKSEGYRFVSFEAVSSEVAAERVICLRHDIDYCPAWAVAMARLNHHCGIAGLFTVQLRSPLYNLAAAETLRCLADIEALGQQIGLHFAFTAPPGDDAEAIAAQVIGDYRIACSLVPTLRPVFSWHNPSLAPGLIERCLDLDVPGMINLYGRRFCRDMDYRADSNWRYSLEAWNAIARDGHPRMQLLFHPFQWLARGTSMLDVLGRTFATVARSCEREFLTNHLYRAAYPAGLPPEAFRSWERAICPVGSPPAPPDERTSSRPPEPPHSDAPPDQPG